MKIAGARFALYKRLGARLESAIANFFLDVHTRENGYTEILPPFIVNTASLTGVGKLPKFAADMFHLEGTDLWLTPTAEIELTSLHRDETLDADELPIRVCAWTSCFRSEAGAAGKDTRGIKRQHQFQKVEMFKFTRPEQSYDELESLVRNARKRFAKTGTALPRDVAVHRRIWDSRPRKHMTSKSGCLLRRSLWRFLPARIVKRFRRAAPEFASSQKAARANSCTR